MLLRLKVRQLKTFKRCFSSALYVTGDKAQNTYVVLIPHIDFENQLTNKANLVENIKARNLNIDLDKIEARWNFYKMLDNQKHTLESTRTELNNMISKLKDNPENEKEIDKLILHVKVVKNDLKNLRDYSYGVEENANLAVLGLPNDLHPETPINSDKVIYEFATKPTETSVDHVKIAQEKNYIHHISPMYCYLKSEGALFEFAMMNYLQKELLNLDYVQFSNADFARSIIIEGCGVDYADKDKVFTLQDPHNDQAHDISRLHLVGGASLFSFMTYFARHTVQPSSFPLKYFSIGRCYKPAASDIPSLFNLDQHSVVETFLAVAEDSQDDYLRKSIEDIIKIYERLGSHFRLVYVMARNLHSAEALRVSIQMFSNSLQNYVEVGNISLYNNYLSKRLLFNYNVNKERKFARVIAGQLINVHKCLACVLENNSSTNAPLLTEFLQKFI